jgi:hypothetical protein
MKQSSMRRFGCDFRFATLASLVDHGERTGPGAPVKVRNRAGNSFRMFTPHARVRRNTIHLAVRQNIIDDLAIF